MIYRYFLLSLYYVFILFSVTFPIYSTLFYCQKPHSFYSSKSIYTMRLIYSIRSYSIHFRPLLSNSMIYGKNRMFGSSYSDIYRLKELYMTQSSSSHSNIIKRKFYTRHRNHSTESISPSQSASLLPTNPIAIDNISNDDNKDINLEGTEDHSPYNTLYQDSNLQSERKVFLPKKGQIYMVATPIGNIGDISIRAANTLFYCDVICAEDTRNTIQLIRILFGDKRRRDQKMISHHEHNWRSQIPYIIQLAKQGNSIAVVSDAGTPGIADPGAELISACISNGIVVSPIPGPSSPIALLSVSGFDSSEFTFFGFIPVKGKERMSKVRRMLAITHSVVFFEAPHRILSSIQLILDTMNSTYGQNSPYSQRPCVLGRELTKIHEELIRGNLMECHEVLTKKLNPIDNNDHLLNDKNRNTMNRMKGEFTVILGPVSIISSTSHFNSNDDNNNGTDIVDHRMDIDETNGHPILSQSDQIYGQLIKLRDDKIPRSEAVKIITDMIKESSIIPMKPSLSKSEIYKIALTIPWNE